MSAVIRIVVALAASLAVSACQGGEGERTTAAGGPAATPPPQAAIAPQPETQPLRAFTPPSDGKITAAQVQKYIAVRQRALELAKQQTSAASSLVQQLAEVVAAENRAASELGYNVNEYRWVQARVAEVSAPAIPEDGQLFKALEAAAAKGSAQLQKTAETERRVPARTQPDPAVLAHNRGVLEPFRADLAALETGRPRPGA